LLPHCQVVGVGAGHRQAGGGDALVQSHLGAAVPGQGPLIDAGSSPPAPMWAKIKCYGRLNLPFQSMNCAGIQTYLPSCGLHPSTTHAQLPNSHSPTPKPAPGTVIRIDLPHCHPTTLVYSATKEPRSGRWVTS